MADGEAGLLTEAGQAVNNLVVSGNVFSGKTFVGAEAGDCGFANQFTAPNVPRQIAVIQTGSGITFTSNQITGTAGSTSSVSGCTTYGQGNTLVTIDANNATIRGNTFAGTTARFGHSLRVRGTGANISCNTFSNVGLGLACVHIFFNTNAVSNLGSPNSLAGVASANTFTTEGAYFTGAEQIYRSSAQVAAIPQTPIAANSAAFPQVTNVNTGEIYCSIQAAINDPLTLNGHTLTVGPGAYAENVVVNKQLTINGPNANIACGSRVAEAIVAPASGVPFTVSADNVTINGFEVTAPSSTYGINFGNTSNVSIKFNNIHDIGTSVTNSNVHAIIYTVGSASTSNASITDNCLDNISSTALSGWSAAAIGVLQSTSTGVLTGLNIERNTINDVQVNTGNWPTGKIAYGITINVGGGGSYLTTSGEVVNAIVRDNEISNLSGFISTGIGMEGNTKNAVVENNSVAGLYGRKVGGTRAAGGYDLSALKIENNRWVGTITVEDNSFQTNTFTHDVTAGLGYAVSNYVPAGVAFTGGGGGTTGEATISCNWLGTATYSQIQDNPSLTGKIFNKDNCVTNFVPYLVNGTDNSGAIGFQPQPTACNGGPVQVYNGPTFVSVHASIQEAIDAATTINGYTVRISTGTYPENVDAATGGKSLIFAPGASPGCVTINGDFTLNTGDDLEMEIEGTTPCTQHDQIIVNGVVTLNNADLVLPPSAFLAQTGDQIVIIDNDGTDAVVGAFAQGNFATDGNNIYYITYDGGTGNDVVLTKCCSGLLDIGIFNHAALTPAGNKLQVKVRPNMDVINGTYSSGTFTIRTLSTNNVTFTNLGSPYGYAQVGTKLTDGGYDYFFFNFDNIFTVNWMENQEYLLLTLRYDCVANATFELINNAFTLANNGDFYQELGAADATGLFYQATATSPAALAITASNNGPVICETMPIDLNSATSDGTPPYTYAWSGPNGYASTDADPAPFAAALASAGTYYVTVTDANGCTETASTTVTVPASGACVLNVNTTLLYPTITQAIDATPTLNGHTLQVPAGTWVENAIVDKELTILGPNAAIDPCSGVRVAEAIVVPATAAISTGEIFHVAADNVTISGFTIDGDNPLLNSGFSSTNGADIDAAEGITVYETGINNLTVTNNILQNLSYFGVTLYDYPAGVASSGHLISNNKFQDFGTYDAGSGVAFWGGGVLLYNNQYARVVNNCMTNVRAGVQTGNFYQANPGAASFQVIDNNTMQVRRRGIFHNLAYSSASAYTLSNNTITGLMNANETVWDGILLSSLSVPSTSTGNTINGAGITNPSEGYEVWNVKNTFPAVISGGSVSNVNTGLFLNNYEGYNSNAGDGAHATVSGLSISPNVAGTGIRLHDNPLSTGANVQLTIGSGVTVTGGTKGLVIERPSASIVGGTLNDLSFTGTTGNYIELISNSGNLNGTAVVFDGTTGAAKTLTQNFATEDKIVHGVDDLPLGFVRVKAGEVFVTPLSGSVQRGVDEATAGDIVNVANGTYNEDVNVNKAVTVDGESTAAIIRGLYAAGLGHSVWMSASNSILKDVTVTRDYGLTVTDWYNCSKNQGVTIGNGTTGVQIDNVVITGNRNGLYINNAQSFTVTNCTIEDNRTGIQLVNNVSNGQIKNNFIRDNFTLGVLYNVFSGTNFIGTNFQLNDNDISGNWYGQVVFHDNGTGGTVGNLTGFNNNCNWYGVTYPAYAAIPAGEPGYGAQVPSQFGGTDPGLNQDIRGTLAHLITYIPFLTNGTDNAPLTAGFQPVAGACNGLGIVVNQTQNLTYPTIQLAVNDADPNDIIFAPAGTYPENVNVTQSVVLRGANFGVAGCSGRGAESIISGGAGTAVTISANGVTIDGFQLDGHTGASSTGFTDVIIQNNKVNAQVLGIGGQAFSTSATDLFTIQGNCIDMLVQAYEAFPFSTDPVVGAQAPGVWYTDRYAPAGFVRENFGGNDRLKHSISAADCQSCRPPSYSSAFYNTQGRKYDIAGTTAMSIQLYVPASWASTGRRMAGFWGTAFDNLNTVSFYPIIEFASEGGVPQFRAWNGSGWVGMGLPTGFAYNQWYTLSIAIEGGNIVYQVGNLRTTIPSPSSVSIGNVILQGHNTDTPGVTYDIYWDNFQTYGSPAATANNPTIGVLVAGAGGSDDVTIDNNSISDAFYGYLLSGVVTSPRTTVRGGTYTNLMQGVAVVNTLDGATYLPSTVGVEDLSFTSFGGDYPALPAFNFHAGVYAFTGGSNAAAVVDLLVDEITVSNTGKTSQASAGLYFADFSTGATPRLNAVVTNSVISNNLNRGVQIRGDNATATVSYCDILSNGSDPYGAGGNDGFGVYAGVGSSINLQNNRIINPATQAGSYPVTAIFNGVAPASTIVANNNLIDRNGNGEVTSNTYGISFFNATCNYWWNTNWIDAIDDLVEGNVLFVPYLNDGTDNAPATVGFQTTASCVNPKHWFVNDNALTGDVYTLAVGNDLNQGTRRRPFLTIGKAITTVVTSDTIYVDAGSYNEQAVVPNTKDNLYFKGAGPTTIVDFTGTVSGKPTLFDIAGDGLKIEGFKFNVDLSKLNSAIIASDPGLDLITILDNRVDPYQSTPGTNFGSYGNRNAFSINYGGPTNYRVASGGVNTIVVDNNIVTATVNGPILGDDAGDIAFRSAVSVDEGAGTYTRNTFQTINHDVLVRFNSNGPVVIGGSVANANTFLGGGVQYSDPNAGGGTVTISHNSFDGSVSGSVLRLQNNYHNAAVSVANNTLSNLRWGMSIENFPNVTVADNTFSPLAGYTTFRHITVNTKSISGNSAAIVQVPINGTFTGNTFNSLTPTTGGTAMAFYNHDSDNETLQPFTIGTAGSPNVFGKDLTWAIYLGDQTGMTLSALATFPEYNLGAGSDTPMDCWNLDMDIQQNTFDVGSGQQLPQNMNNAQRLALEGILFHDPDVPCLGLLTYFTPVTVDAKVFLQGPYDSVSNLMKDDLRTGNLIPLSEPYSSINTANPGSFVEVNNFVVETVAPAVLTVAGADAIVDWVWLELRDKNNFNTVVATRAALVQRDGDIVDLDGVSNVTFPDSYIGEYYLLVRHRNHLGAMTAAAVNFTPFPPFIDFTTAAQATYGTTSTSARRLIETATYGLWAGNTIPKSPGGFQIKYNGSDNDRVPILNVVGTSTPLNVVSNVYMLEDVNMNGQVKYSGSGNDRVIILNNVGPATPLNVITQQPNN
ncbi:MAG: right-handed parallel beta-helix repeat-containing protein [Saprospiraceae bacterium]